MRINREFDPAITDSIASLRREHAELDRKLEALNGRPYLTPQEQVERKRIQKLKLLKKDKIEMLQRRGRN